MTAHRGVVLDAPATLTLDRYGDFYEAIGDDNARTVAAFTGREIVRMKDDRLTCGIPYWQIDAVCQSLIQHGYTVLVDGARSDEHLNTICQQCGYASPIHYVDPAKGRYKLMLHSHYTGRCPITGGSVDERSEVK